MKTLRTVLLACLLAATAALSACSGTDSPAKKSGSATGNENQPSDTQARYLIMPGDCSETNDGFVYKCFVYDQNGKTVTDASLTTVHVKLTNQKGDVICDEDVPLTVEDKTFLVASVDYAGLKSSTNVGTAEILVTMDGAEDYRVSYPIHKLPLDLSGEIKLSDKRTADYCTAKGAVKATSEITGMSYSYTPFSKNITVTFDFTCRISYAAEKSGDYGAFYIVFTDDDGTVLDRKSVFKKVESDGTFTASVLLSGYVPGTGVTVSFENY